MKLLSPARAVDRPVATMIQRRWRWAALAGLILFLVLSGYALAVTGASNASKVRPTPVLVAATDIRVGSTITDTMLRVTAISPQDPGLLTTLVKAGDRSTIVGQVAAMSVAAGHLIPAEIVSPQIHSQLWIAAVPIKRMPADLIAGEIEDRVESGLLQRERLGRVRDRRLDGAALQGSKGFGLRS